MLSIKDGSSVKSFENGTVTLSAKETKWTSLGVRTHSTLLETLILKYDFGLVKLPGLSRNRPQNSHVDSNEGWPGQYSRATGFNPGGPLSGELKIMNLVLAVVEAPQQL